MYHYVLTKDYPYTVGCFKGAKVSESVSSSLPVQMSDDSQSRLLLPEGQQMDEGFQMATSGRPLLVGMKGKDIEELQKMLEQFGYLVMPKNVTKGIFGTKTKDAVKRFQKDNNVTQTGTFGPKSRKAARERKGAVSRSVQLETRTDTSAPSSRPMNMRVRTATTTSSFHPEDMRGGDSNQQGNDAPPMNVQMSHEMGRADAMPLPPQEAVTACDSLQENDVCGFSRPDNGEKISGTCREIHEDLACVPSRR
jgi:peptidoglycan hydrolase-like protein with peptidoglycan-binding domain